MHSTEGLSSLRSALELNIVLLKENKAQHVNSFTSFQVVREQDGPARRDEERLTWSEQMRKTFSRQSKTEVQARLWRELLRHWEDEAWDRDWDMMYREWQSEPDPPDMLDGLWLYYGGLDSDTLVLDEGIAITLHRSPDGTEVANCVPAAEWFEMPANPIRQLQMRLSNGQ